MLDMQQDLSSVFAALGDPTRLAIIQRLSEGEASVQELAEPFDISGPAITPWMLHRALPSSELHIVEVEGHGGEREMQLTSEAIDRFALAAASRDDAQPSS